MKDDTGRKNWTKPEIIILIRNKPEEMVLTACKGTDLDGASNEFDNCIGPAPCSPCSSIGDS